ncbi:MBL fold metallo-hydrolase [Paenibacillus pedocola]|uniref:MBL fold metallo-hydrolase n=1 Tax=Paenibacillus pedocola TaxID=3242193 RepID=UPI002877D136|nr:MBL fold metallo-hydrolase [Paenibacillus typhae]
MFHSRHFSIHPLAEGIYALIATEQGGAMSNAGIMDMGGFTLIFDTFNTPQAGKDLREAALHLFDQPIGYVINSHWHGDHVRGNQFFTGETIVSSSRARELMQETQPQWLTRMTPLLPKLEADIAEAADKLSSEPEQEKRLRLASEHNYLLEIRESIETLAVTYPELTYEHQLTLHGSKRSVRLLSLGRAHTECDSILYSPADSLVFAGDVIAIRNHPLFTDGDPHSWLNALDALEKLGAKQIVPGHGPVGDAGSIKYMQEYIRDLLAVSQQYRGLEPKPDAAGIPVPEAYRDWNATGVYYRNLEFLLNRSF